MYLGLTLVELMEVVRSCDSIEIEDSAYQDQPPAEVLQSFEPPSLPPS